MDNTELYIKMADCPEIQGLATQYTLFDRGSIAVINGEYHKNEIVVLAELSYYSDDYEWELVTWLPRQDQLQGMYRQEKETWLEVIADFSWVIIDMDRTSEKYYWQFTSMEQLWLAFVMKEKHNKTWNGEEWVTTD